MSNSIARLSIEQMIELRLQAQLEGILQDVNEIYQRIPKTSGDDPNQMGYSDLRLLLEGFFTFSNDYCNFITHTSHLFEEKLEIRFTRHYAALEKILREWLSLRPMLMQQLAMQTIATGNHLVECLKVADEYTKACIRLQSVRGIVPEKNQQPRTYFQKTYTISRFAYTHRIPAIAIPLDVWHEPWHWMGLAHEVGHYVYWNFPAHDEKVTLDGKPTLEQRLKQEMRETLWEITHDLEWEESDSIRDMWRTWVEEVFSDVYGALILGPAYIESLIAWLAPQGISEALYANDEDHPAPILRPLLQIAALRQLVNSPNSSLAIELDYLESNWLAYCAAFVNDDKPLDLSIGKVAAKKVYACVNVIATAVIKILRDFGTTKEFYSDAAHQQVIATAQQLSTEATAVHASGREINELALSVSWYAWSDMMAAGKHADTQKIRSWLGLPVMTKQQLSPTPERVFIESFLPEKVQTLTPSLKEYVDDVLVQKNIDLPKKYTRKPAYLNDLIDDILSGEFSTEEGAILIPCHKCGLGCNSCRRITDNTSAPKCGICNRYYRNCSSGC